MTNMDVASSRQHASQESTRQPIPKGTSNPAPEGLTLNESSCHVGSDDNMESTTQAGSRRLKSDPKRADNISMLPDDILYHVLSFLPTRQVVATSVLSKRWRLLCTSVDILITQRNYKSYLSFVNDIDAIILARDVHPSMHPPIRKFRLRCWFYDNFHPYASNVNAWVNALIRQRIENLDMELNSDMILSCHIFRCKTLVVLKLTNISLHGCSSVELPSLKSLHLVGVNFRQPQHLMELLCGLPILEVLVARCIHFTHPDVSFCKEEFKSLPKLVSAELLSYKGYSDVPLKAISNVESLSIRQSGLDKVIPEFPNLIHLVLSSVSNCNLVLEMLKNCPKLEVFELVFHGCPDYEPFPYPHFVPQCLTSRLTKCSLEFIYCAEDELQLAKYIMQNSTTLRTMTIRSPYSLFPELTCKFFQELALCPKISPMCELLFK